MNLYKFGLIGLGVMGQNLALNIERNGFSLAGYDLDEARLKNAGDLFSGKDMKVCNNLNDFINSLESPKKVMLMVPAGKAVDSVIQDIKPLLSKGDIIIDGGNSFYKDTEQRWAELKNDGLLYIGTGVSGGEEGALWGPAIMPGGDRDAWVHVQPVFQAIAAKVDKDVPCCSWMGEGGAGHFVKMVHNGIEYGDMQMICEAYFIMNRLLKLTPDEMHKVFSGWNRGELNSYLIEITADIMAKKDNMTSKPMIEVILDTAGQKGTGKWTSQTALDFGIPAQTIAEAVFARTISALKEERVQASKQLKGPGKTFTGNKVEFIEDIRKALYASKICSYAQGFQILRAASEEYNWNLKMGDIALLWRGGCIIRAQFLGNIKDAFDKNNDLPNLMVDEYFKTSIDTCQNSWRKVVANAVECGIPVPAFSSALSYYDGYRTERLPANLLQAQRDYFGAHTYERIDKSRGEFFHTQWTE